MNADDVRKRVVDIEAASGDDETAHCEEDNLHIAVLRAIAEGQCDDPAACATEALKTLEVSFSRWYA